MPKVQPNEDDIIAKCHQRLTAFEKHLTDAKTTIDVNGKTCSIAQVKSIYQESLDVRAEVRTQRAQLKALLAKRARIEAQRIAADRALKPWVVNKFGEKSGQALEFGFPPAKVGTMTAMEKLRAVELRKATREARHTMGSRQRQKIRGVVAPENGAPPASEE